MELDALKKWYEDICKSAEWFKCMDLQDAIDRKENLRVRYEEAIRKADKALVAYTYILNKRDFLLECIRQIDPEFEGISSEKEGE